MNFKTLFIGLFICIASFSQAQTATKILSKASEQAKLENKNVFVIFHASWCGWCKKMEQNLETETIKPYFDANYVKAFITVQERKDKKNLETPEGDLVLEKFAGTNQGLPYWVILDSKGKILEDSRVNGENLGSPATEEEVGHLITKLENTSKNVKVKPEEVKEIFILKKQ